VKTLDDDNRPAPVGVTRTRCATCKRFARLLPGDTDCSTCLGVLPLDLTVSPLRGGRR
jgi:hypothetical protein